MEKIQELAIAHKNIVDIPFSEISGEHIGDASYRFFVKWGTLELRRTTYIAHPKYKPVWLIGMTIISNLTIENGDAIAEALEEKYQRETTGKIIPLMENLL